MFLYWQSLVIKGFKLEAGPQIGFLTAATSDVEISGDGASAVRY